MASAFFWMDQARRWSACVDYGSPMGAWTQEMRDVLREHDGDKRTAMDEIRRRRATRRRHGDMRP